MTQNNYEKKVVTLDGEKNFIEVIVTSKDRSKDLYSIKVHKNSEDLFKFTSIEMANLSAKKLIDHKVKSFKFVFHLGDTVFDINRTQEFKFKDFGYNYEFYDDDSHIKFCIIEKKVHRLTKGGYICFENGNEKFCEKEYGFKRQPELIAWISKIISNNIKNRNGIISIDHISKKEMVLKLEESTARIHILTNSKLMDINQERKETNTMCLPYIRNMDKFTTFPVYVAKNIQERMYFDSDQKSADIISNLVTDLRNDCPGTELERISPKWVETDFHGYITINENKF